MYKTRCYLVMLSWLSIHFSFAQQTVGKSALAYLTSNVSTNRQTAFTVHLLALLVDPEKKHAFAV